VVTDSVNLKDPDLEEAATVIQARYRGYATRKHQEEERREAQNHEEDGDGEAGLKEVGDQLKEEQQPEPSTNKGEEEEEEEGKKIDMANQEEEVDIDLNDPGVGSAAVKIQASFRGHQVRRQAEKDKAKADAELAEEMQKLKTAKVEEEEELPDLNDPEIHKAATKIQAQFKGHMVRKKKEGDDASKWLNTP